MLIFKVDFLGRELDKEGQSVQTSSYEMNKYWGYHVLHNGNTAV